VAILSAMSPDNPTHVRAAPEAIADPFSAMTPRFSFFFRRFGRRFFRHLELDQSTVETLRGLESRGSVVYVMRYASRLDYFLFNWLFLRDGLRLSGFANGVAFYYYRPLVEAAQLLWRRLDLHRWLPGSRERAHEHKLGREHVHELVRSGESLFLFMRTARVGSVLQGRRDAVRAGQNELDFLGEIVGSVWNDDRPVYLVPLALFWRKGPRRSARRFLNLGYGAATRPTDVAKVTSFLLNYRNLKIKVGEAIDLRAFVGERRAEGAATLARKVKRSLLLHLYREEKLVQGAPIQPFHRVEEEVFSDAAFGAVLSEYAEQKDIRIEAARAQASKMLREIAARMNSTVLAILSIAVTLILRRMFGNIDVTGLEKVEGYSRQHPIVLVPSHRSYFDFVILQWLFYSRHMMPPHILARENMGFGPFGFLFRRVGAFFMRRSFDDPLYKEVFRRYITYLVRQGYSQEFFIEGGRSRTGKSLSPKLGFLNWDVEAFLATGRRDLFFVPTAITYERLVEEGAMVSELEGDEKQEESMLGLLRARKFLQLRFGSVHVNFGEPISLADALGDRRERFAGAEALAERREFVEGLGNRLIERINWATVANSTTVAACALLGEPRRGLLRHELVARMQQIVDLLRIQDVRMTAALRADEGEFRESIAFLQRSDLIHSMDDSHGETLYFDESKRRALDIYRNAIIHFLAAPSFLALELGEGGTAAELRGRVAGWLDLLYQEFYAPREEILVAHVDGFLDYFERFGMIEHREDRLLASEKGRAYFAFLSAQTRGVLEAYCAAFTAAQELGEEPVGRRALQKQIEAQFERAQLLGVALRPEGRNPITFQNALELLARRRILVRSLGRRGRDRRREPNFSRGPAFDELGALCERLAAVLVHG
jgi:glycerol-3-phosphate O-acyltransferase